MTDWISRDETPPQTRPLLCHCPDWNESGYQVANHDGSKFYYADAPNDDFDETVESWSLFVEAN